MQIGVVCHGLPYRGGRGCRAMGQKEGGRKKAALACLEARLIQVFCGLSKVVERALVFALEK